MKHPKNSVLLLLLLLLLAAAKDGQAAVCYVSPTGNASITDCTDASNPCRDFKFPIESAVPKCTHIEAAAGLYTGPNNTDISGTLPLSINGAGNVIIDTQGQGRFLSISQSAAAVSNSTFELKGVQICNALSTTGSRGGALLLSVSSITQSFNSSAALFENVSFINNSKTGGSEAGGAVAIIGLPALFRGVEFRGNRVSCSGGSGSCFGGAVRFEKSANSIPEYIFEDCSFESNAVTSFISSAGALAAGGAISLGAPTTAGTATSTVIIRRTAFIENSVINLGTESDEIQGGAISAIDANITIECAAVDKELCTLSGNRVFSASTAGLRDLVIGGAVSATSVVLSTPNAVNLHMRNAVLYNNSISCDDPDSCGIQFGGGALASSRVLIDGCDFCNNSAQGGSGAHILIISSADTEMLSAGPTTNVFTCNNTGAAIEPISFTCSSPDCIFPTAIVDPDTDICSPCQLITNATATATATATGN